MPDAPGCKPPLLPDAARCKPISLSTIATAIATWLGALSRSHAAHHKKREGERAEVQKEAQGEKGCCLHRSVWCTFRLWDAAWCRSPILPDAAGCEPSPPAGCCQMQKKNLPDASEKSATECSLRRASNAIPRAPGPPAAPPAPLLVVPTLEIAAADAETPAPVPAGLRQAASSSPNRPR